MYKVINVMPGPLGISLEKGSIILNKGNAFDLEGDGGCSRKWINSDPALASLLKSGALAVLFDSEKRLPQPDLTTDLRKPNKPKKAPKIDLPTVVELSDVEEIEEEPPVIETEEVEPELILDDEDISEDEKTDDDDFAFVMDDDEEELEDEEDTEEDKEKPEEAPKDVDGLIEKYSSMGYNELRKLASSKYSIKTFGKTKDELVDELVELLSQE